MHAANQRHRYDQSRGESLSGPSLWQTSFRYHMSDVIDTEGFRANVGIVLMHGDGSVFLGRRARGGGWQFPQGGMQTGETPEESLFRELHEEIGLTQADVELIGATRDWIRYTLPPRYIRREQLPLCIGQKQRWYLLRLREDATQFAFT